MELLKRYLMVVPLFSFVGIYGPATAADSARADTTDKQEFYRQKVEPLLVHRCLGCHGSDRKGGLDLRSERPARRGGESGPALVPGDPVNSLLFDYVSSGTMPPEKPLPASEIAVLNRWIENGAYFPDSEINPFAFTTDKRAGLDWWSLQPVRRPPVPNTAHGQTVLTPVDAFVVARLNGAGLTFAPPADRATYIRRVTIDLTGLPPTYEEIEDFVSDTRVDAAERLVDRLLASPRYGERWGRHWLDVVRFAESNGFERDRIRSNFWRYRDYVIEAFNRDVPFDQFVREQLAGDALRPDDSKALIATGFLVAGPKNDVATISELEKLQTRQDELDEYVVATGSTFLGLTIGCARCHDHKFDPITSKDYYRLTAVFSGLDRRDNVVATPAQKATHAAQKSAIQGRIDQAQSEVDALLEPIRKRLLSENSKMHLDRQWPMVEIASNVDVFKPVTAKYVRFHVLATNTHNQPCLDELEIYEQGTDENVARGGRPKASSLLPGFPIHQIEHLNDGEYGNAHSWISNEKEGGWAQIELSRPTTIARVVWGRDRTRRYRDRLAIGYQIDVSLDEKNWQTVSDSSRRKPFLDDAARKAEKNRLDQHVVASLTDEQRARFDRLLDDMTRAEADLKRVPPLPVSYSVRDAAPQATFLLSRGNVRDRAEQVSARAPDCLSLPANLVDPRNDSGPRRRLLLAKWIVHPSNPLTPRVLVNRIWHYHFGNGIVRTPSDFGFNGDRPSHPKLLDWLAADLVEHGWRVKRLHRMIVLSRAYRQSSAYVDDAASKDGDNRLLWRFAPRRLDAESLRDAILQVSGNLDLTMGGPGFQLFRYRDGNVPDYLLVDDPGSSTWRRAVYRTNIRTFRHPLLMAFDCPDPTVATPSRERTTTALQALSLMNNPFVFTQSKHFARRIGRSDARSQAVLAYRFALARNPSEPELIGAAEFVRGFGLLSLCRVLFNTNEFLYVH